EVIDESGRPLPIRGAMERALLTLLLLDAGRVIPTERLVDALWDDQPPATAHNSLQVRVARLRKALGRDRIVTRGAGYLLQLDGGELDLSRAEQLLEQGDIASLIEAQALWRGPALAEFAHEPWARAPAARLEELRLAAVEKRIDAELEQGHQAALV